MIKLKPLIKEIYTEPTNSKMTSLDCGASKWLKWLDKKHPFKGTVIDYGCGRVARNSVYLRERGLKVYSYDKFWGKSGVDGWNDITNELPTESFDVGFTSFVLNVINISEETEILQWMNKHCKKEFHITRNQDINIMVKDALLRKDKTVSNFFTQIYHGDLNKPLTDADIDAFVVFGTKTNKGFQRLPELQFKGYKLIKISQQVKIYERE